MLPATSAGKLCLPFVGRSFLDARWDLLSDLGLDADNLYVGRFPGLRALRTLKPVLHSPRESFGSNLQRDCDVVTMNSVAFVE